MATVTVTHEVYKTVCTAWDLSRANSGLLPAATSTALAVSSTIAPTSTATPSTAIVLSLMLPAKIVAITPYVVYSWMGYALEWVLSRSLDIFVGVYYCVLPEAFVLFIVVGWAVSLARWDHRPAHLLESATETTASPAAYPLELRLSDAWSISLLVGVHSVLLRLFHSPPAAWLDVAEFRAIHEVTFGWHSLQTMWIIGCFGLTLIMMFAACEGAKTLWERFRAWSAEQQANAGWIFAAYPTTAKVAEKTVEVHAASGSAVSKFEV
ncbi:hypothetical protein LTR36_002771 [Oleoguttula mirabilis]|uniref:Uncharacterized protein n=1 Tax=Oleoguttula mirabilis TaxID=1507867 RepID=A0AAV9JJR7_9PEZI|nr:hypothetical protein LTR36_002771 [Oleoguttula mirabilis]